MNVTVILSLPLFVRNYLTTKIFEQVPGYTFDFIVERKLLEDPDVNKAKIIGTFDVPMSLLKRQLRLFDVVTWRYRHLSRSFLFRIKRIYFYNTGKRDHLFLLKRIYLTLSFLKTVVLGLPLIFNFYKWLCEKTIPVPEGLEDAIRKSTSKLILFPTTSFDPAANNIIELCRKYGKTSIFLIDNWDNLSSKSLFLKLPDYFGVWGEQSKQHAIDIQRAAPATVVPIGTPRFEVYRRTPGASPYPFPYVTFCGCAIAFDEVTALEELDKEIESNKSIYGGMKIVYRPHPWRQPRLKEKKFSAANFKHVVLDKQMAYRVETEDIRADVQPDLNYYPDLLKNSLGSVCPLSTMLIENVLCERPVLVLAYDDGVHKTSPSFSIQNYMHFDGIENIKGIKMVRNLKGFADDFREFFRHPMVTVTGSDASYIVTFDQQPYTEHLRQLLLRCEAAQ